MAERVLRFAEVVVRTGLCKATIYNKLRASPPDFPRRIYLGPNAVGFLESSLRSLVTFQRTATSGAVDALAHGLAQIARQARRRSLRLVRIDGAAAAQSRWLDGLVRCGWQLEGDALAFRRDG